MTEPKEVKSYSLEVAPVEMSLATLKDMKDMNTMTVIQPMLTENREKLVMVPTRRRTGHPAPSESNVSFRRVELPATPYGPPAPHTGSKVQPTPGGGWPASTPLAAEVLASLNLALPPLSIQNKLQRQDIAMAPPRMDALFAPLPPPPSLEVGVNAVGGERQACKCKRSQCLKLYCDCFAAGGFCLPSCTCNGCRNTQRYNRMVQKARSIVLAKDPTAFQVKVDVEGHKKGCKCKRSRCLKKYCECYLAGTKCNPDTCICEGCLNCEDPKPDTDAPGFADTWTIPAIHNTIVVEEPIEQQEKKREGTLVDADETMAPILPMPGLPGMFINATTGAPVIIPEGIPPPPPELYRHMAAAAIIAAANGNAPELLPMDMTADLIAQAAAAAAGISVPCARIDGCGTVYDHGMSGKEPSALVSHLSDVPAPTGEDIIDTASSPAPHMAVAQLKRTAETLTGGSKGLGARMLIPARVRSLAAGVSFSAASPAISADSHDSAAHRAKRPKRAASGGVLGAVAAETSDWGLDVVSPPLKRAHSLPSAPEVEAGNKYKAQERVALLKKALHSETLRLRDIEPASGVEEADAVSALFELSGSQY